MGAGLLMAEEKAGAPVACCRQRRRGGGIGVGEDVGETRTKRGEMMSRMGGARQMALGQRRCSLVGGVVRDQCLECRSF